jgi:drug/metabolite transporter (DMT)-like permease
VTPTTLALVLASAVIHSVWNLWTKQIRDDTRSAPLLWLLTSLSAVFYAPVALLIAVRTGFVLTPLAAAWMAASALIHVGYFLLLLRGYRASDLSVVYPVARGTGPLLAAVGAVVLLGEQVTWNAVLGIALVTAGILVLTLRPGFLATPGLRAGIGYGLMTGVTIAAYTLWDGSAVSRVGLHPIVYYWGGELVRVVVFSPGAVADRDGVRRLWHTHRARVLGIALLSPLGYMLVLIAFQHGQVSHIAPVRELSILFGTWLGARVLGEGDRTRRLVAAAAFAAGVIALALR